MNNVLKNPLWFFIAIGVLLFGADHFVLNPKQEKKEIRVTQQEVDKLIENYRGMHGVDPDSAKIRQLIQIDIENRLLSDFGMELGLDQNDIMVRDRVAEVTEQYILAGANLSDPGDEELTSYLAANQDQFIIPAYYDFSQYYFGKDENQALQQLRSLQSKNTIKGYSNDEIDIKQKGSINQIAKLFGVLFAGELENHTGDWVGVIESNFGYHVVKVHYYSPPHNIDLNNIEERYIVLNKWRTAKQNEYLEHKLDIIKAPYAIQVENYSYY